MLKHLLTQVGNISLAAILSERHQGSFQILNPFKTPFKAGAYTL